MRPRSAVRGPDARRRCCATRARFPREVGALGNSSCRRVTARRSRSSILQCRRARAMHLMRSSSSRTDACRIRALPAARSRPRRIRGSLQPTVRSARRTGDTRARARRRATENRTARERSPSRYLRERSSDRDTHRDRRARSLPRCSAPASRDAMTRASRTDRVASTRRPVLPAVSWASDPSTRRAATTRIARSEDSEKADQPGQQRYRPAVRLSRP